ncbi:MAG: TAXI family TRAP transporter solute-binding subunit, partial [Telluria sp.]
MRLFSIVSLRDLLVASGPTLLAVATVAVLAYLWVDPAPPRRLVMATGQFNSAYQEFGRQYAAQLARDEIVLTLQPSLGSHENLQRLLDGKADIAFVQSGSTEDGQARNAGLVSLGSLFTEPVWLFLRESAKVAHLTDLKGKRINLGPEGTGVPRLFRQVLDANGIEPSDMKIGALENTPATMALLAGEVDGLVFSSAPEAPLIQMLLQTPGIKLFNFTQADAYTRRLPFLTHVVLPRGIVDLARDLPPQDVRLVATT